jgi:tetratricopeptide (TPR) repeat protein
MSTSIWGGCAVPSSAQSVEAFEMLPDPGQAGTLDHLVEQLRLLKVWAGNPSYGWIAGRVNAAWTAAGRPAGELVGKTTIVDCFRPGRRRINPDLVVAVVAALHPDRGYVAHWRQALQVIAGRAQASAQVRVQDGLPPELAGFTGRAVELDRIWRALHQGATGTGGAVLISAIAGMAGVGKTQLAVHAGHLLAREKTVDRVLFVNLRGFHSDPSQPPADPAAVLDGFLRVLGAPGTHIPHDLAARTAAYRARLAGTRTLLVLDNATDADQIGPLLPDTPGCLVLVTSRRSLTDLDTATHLALDVFTHAEATAFLARHAAGRPVGPDPHAPDRIARRCGHLPLALGLIAAHVRATPGWTLTDHADRLDERHHQRHLDTGVKLALDLSYQQLPADRQRLLRLASLHPGQDLDTHAAAALIDTDLPTAEANLDRLRRDHLLQPAAPGRYTLHDLVRDYGTSRAGDEDPPPERRTALTRLFDYYLATAATAMDILHPGEAHRRPRIPPPSTPAPALADPETALGWLDTERPTLAAVAAHTATHGWPTHTTGLSATLNRYLAGGYYTDALIVHSHAHHAARVAGDPAEQAHILVRLGATQMQLGRHQPAIEHFQQALTLSRQASDPSGQARALTGLGVAEARLGRCGAAAHYHDQALPLCRQAGDPVGEVRTLTNLGIVELRLGRHRRACDHFQHALTLSQQAGDAAGEADTTCGLGIAELRRGRYGPAAKYLHEALTQYRQLGIRTGEAWTLEGLGTLHTCLGQPAEAFQHHRQALAIFGETGDRDGESWALNGLGEAAHTNRSPTDSLTHHTDALSIATDTNHRDQQARAHTGMGRAHHTLGNPTQARHHYQHALTLYTDLGTPEADHIRTQLGAIDDNGVEPSDRQRAWTATRTQGR